MNGNDIIQSRIVRRLGTGRKRMAACKIAVTAGDWIGKEVAPEGVRVLECAARRFGLDLAWDRLDWGRDRHARFRRMTRGRGLESRISFGMAIAAVSVLAKPKVAADG